MDAAHEPNRLRTPRPAGPVQCEGPAGRTVSRDRSGLSGGGRRTRSGPAEGMGTRGDDLHARRWRITNNRSEGDAGELRIKNRGFRFKAEAAFPTHIPAPSSA